MSDRELDGAPLLEVRGLTVAYGRGNVLDGIDLHIAPGEAYGLVGESGCGKTTTARAITRALPASARAAGAIGVAGRDVLALRGEALREYRARDVATVHEEPGSALNPTMRVGRQVAEVFENHGLHRRDAAAAAIDALARTVLADPAVIARRYPHELSGGQQQRVVIAMALAARPRLLILDEPTTGLDATTAVGVLGLVAELRREIGASVLFISHNLALVRRLCDRVGVLYSGRIVEEGTTHDVIARPRHPYSDGLLRCVPRLDAAKGTVVLEPLPGTLPSPADRPAGCVFSDRCHAVTEACRSAEPPLTADVTGRLVRCRHPGAPLPEPAVAAAAAADAVGRPVHESPLLRLEGVTVRYGDVLACDDIHLTVGRGEVLAVIGESGSGKTTLARCVVGLVDYQGRIELDGLALRPLVEQRRRDVRQRVQMVFQSPDATLNPRHTVRAVLGRAIRRLGGDASVEELAATVRLDPSLVTMPTRVLSGGQKQRVAIARSFAGRPSLVVCDEPVSALDVSVQAAILQLLTDLQRRTAVSYLLISHDLGVVRYIADRIAVMYCGQIVEVGTGNEVFDGPRHPYTDTLVASARASAAGPDLAGFGVLGEEPGHDAPRGGCRFHSRCPRAIAELCRTEPPPWQIVGDGHQVRCHLHPVDLASSTSTDESDSLRYHLGGASRRERHD